jgi:hypothetical protein
MIKINRSLLVAGIAATLSLGAFNSPAQDRQGGRGNFDPARAEEFRQRRMDDLKERLEIKDDTEWKAVQPLIQKVMDTQQSMFADRMRGAFRGFGRRGGDNAGGGGDNGGDNRRQRGFGGEPSPEAEALQKAIDGKASNSELKAALAKYQESRKAKQADLEKAQTDLRKVLSLRQEAILTSSGLL